MRDGRSDMERKYTHEMKKYKRDMWCGALF